MDFLNCKCRMCFVRNNPALVKGASKGASDGEFRDLGSNQLHTNLHVQNIPLSWGDQQLGELFSTCGPVVSSKVMRDPVRNTSKGYGFVKFSDIGSALNAINRLNRLVRCLLLSVYDHDIWPHRGH